MKCSGIGFSITPSSANISLHVDIAGSAVVTVDYVGAIHLVFRLSIGPPKPKNPTYSDTR